MAATKRPNAARHPRGQRVLVITVILIALACCGAFLDWAVRHNGPARRTSAGPDHQRGRQPPP
jgi:hypothetical protein